MTSSKLRLQNSHLTSLCAASSKLGHQTRHCGDVIEITSPKCFIKTMQQFF